jgi:hypothetical protein
MSDELTILTAEHATMQAARSACLQDIQGRTTFFLTVVSGTLVALGFLGAANQFGRFFVVFAVTLLFFVWVLGVLTFLRTVQIGVEDTLIAFGISRVRHRYTELAPSVARLFVRSIHDDVAGMRAEMGTTDRWWQALMPTQSLIAFVVSVIGGCAIAVILTFVVHTGFLPAVAGGIAAWALNLFVLTSLSARLWMSVVGRFSALFPTQE